MCTYCPAWRNPRFWTNKLLFNQNTVDPNAFEARSSYLGILFTPTIPFLFSTCAISVDVHLEYSPSRERYWKGPKSGNTRIGNGIKAGSWPVRERRQEGTNTAWLLMSLLVSKVQRSKYEWRGHLLQVGKKCANAADTTPHFLDIRSHLSMKY